MVRNYSTDNATTLSFMQIKQSSGILLVSKNRKIHV